MRTSSSTFASALLLAAASASAQHLLISPAPPSSVVVDDTFANGNSQKQDIANNSLWLFNGRSTTVRTDKVGSASFDITATGTNSEAFWAYFTAAGSPINLGVGDTLTVSVTFSLSGFKNNGQDIRWGVLNSLGTRNSANLTGGMNDSTFVGDTGYGLDYYASGTGSPFVVGTRSVLTNANVFNSFGDFQTISGTGANARQPLVDNTPYTLTYTIQRLSATSTQIYSAVTGGALSGLNYTATESSSTPNTAFDYFAFRFGGTNFTTGIAFSELLVKYVPAAPTITSQPQPSAMTLQVGGNVTLAVGASGNSLKYQWQKDGNSIQGNASATTSTLSLTNVQLSDAGTYTAAVSNAGGSVTSSPVTLKVSTSPVPPAPAITRQPATLSVTVGQYTSMFVNASGDNLVYQWFKGSTPIAGATDLQFRIASAAASDAGSYSVVISNSSGSVQSQAATLTVLSPMNATSFGPANWGAGTCVDTPLTITFDRTPAAGTSGQLRVYNSANKVVDTIDMTANPQSKIVGGLPFSYSPILVSGNTAVILLHKTLAYGDSYYVVMDPGVVVDSAGLPFRGMTASAWWSFDTKSAAPAAGASAFTVSADGQGDFCTVQGAIDAVPANNTQLVTITVNAGTYNEIVYVPSTKPYITVQGVDRAKTIVQYPNNNSLNPSTTSRPLFGVDATDFTLQNITVWNTTPHGGSQAEAFRGNNSRILLNRVTLKSYQDTLLLQGTGFVTDSYIEGDVDFMWGTGAVFLQNSELKALTSSGYYTQIRNGQGQYGYVFVNDQLTAASGVTGMYLARIDPTVFPYSQVVFINCAMGTQVASAGWLLNNATAAPSVQFWESGSTDLTGAKLDVSQRASFSQQISGATVSQLSDPSNVLGGWTPYTVNSPAGPVAKNAALTVDWSAPKAHSATDWIGLFLVGDPDTNPLSRQSVTAATTGQLTFRAPVAVGTFEFRFFQNNTTTRAAMGNQFAVQ